MEIRSISSLEPLAPVGKASGQDSSGEFSNILADAIENANQTELQSQQGMQGLLTGDINDISGTIIDTEKADVALRLTIQIRNKVIDAYTEVMRMQV